MKEQTKRKKIPRHTNRMHTPELPNEGWLSLRPYIEERINLGILQETLSSAANWSSSWCCALERGAQKVTKPTLERYRKALDMCKRLGFGRKAGV